MLPAEALREVLPAPSSSEWSRAFLGWWSYPSIATWPSPHPRSPAAFLLRGYLSLYLGSTQLVQGDLISRSLTCHVCKDPFSRYSHVLRFSVLGGGHAFWGSITQPMQQPRHTELLPCAGDIASITPVLSETLPGTFCPLQLTDDDTEAHRGEMHEGCVAGPGSEQLSWPSAQDCWASRTRFLPG